MCTHSWQRPVLRTNTQVRNHFCISPSKTMAAHNYSVQVQIGTRCHPIVTSAFRRTRPLILQLCYRPSCWEGAPGVGVKNFWLSSRWLAGVSNGSLAAGCPDGWIRESTPTASSSLSAELYAYFLLAVCLGLASKNNLSLSACSKRVSLASAMNFQDVISLVMSL